MEKNKIGSVLLCGFLIFMTTHYYSALNQAPTRAMGAAGFPREYLPHYTIILVMFVVSIALVTISFLIQNRKISGDRVFLLATLSATVIILSVLTVSSIVDYVDLNGLGVDGRFTILILLSLLMNGVSLALLARRYKRQIAEKRKVKSEAPAA